MRRGEGEAPPGYSWEPRARRWRGPGGRWVSEVEVRRVRRAAAAAGTVPTVAPQAPLVPAIVQHVDFSRGPQPLQRPEPAPEPTITHLHSAPSLLSAQALLAHCPLTLQQVDVTNALLQVPTENNVADVARPIHQIDAWLLDAGSPEVASTQLPWIPAPPEVLRSVRACGAWRRLFLAFQEEAQDRWRVVQLVFLYEHRGRRLRWSDPLSRRAPRSPRGTPLSAAGAADADDWHIVLRIIHRVITSTAFRRVASFLLERCFAVIRSRPAKAAAAGGAAYVAKVLLLEGGSNSTTI